MDFHKKIEKALTLVDDLDQVAYLEEKIQTTSQINRRTKAGRELTSELLTLCHVKALQLIDAGAQPF